MGTFFGDLLGIGVLSVLIPQLFNAWTDDSDWPNAAWRVRAFWITSGALFVFFSVSYLVSLCH